MFYRSCLVFLLLIGVLLFEGCAGTTKNPTTSTTKQWSEQNEDTNNDSTETTTSSESIKQDSERSTTSTEENNLDSSTESHLPSKEDTEAQSDMKISSSEPTESKTSKPSIQSIRLDVPQKIQENSYYCAVACLQMVLDYHGITANQSELAQKLHTDPVTGTEYADLAREASVYIFGKEPQSSNDLGYRAVLWKRNQGDDALREQFESRAVLDLSNNDPLFVSVNIAQAYKEQNDGVHELVVYGADLNEEGKVQTFYCIDPSYLRQDAVYGGKKMFSANELWNAMNNNPEPGYVW